MAAKRPRRTPPPAERPQSPPQRLRPSRVSGKKILADLRLAARRGDRSALALALEQMRMLAHSPRYWERYLGLLGNPMARLVDLLVIKQGERIAHLKGWKPPRPIPPEQAARRKNAAREKAARTSRRRQESAANQPSLFELG